MKLQISMNSLKGSRLLSTLDKGAANAARWKPEVDKRLLVSSSRNMISSSDDLNISSHEQLKKSRDLMARCTFTVPA